MKACWFFDKFATQALLQTQKKNHLSFYTRVPDVFLGEGQPWRMQLVLKDSAYIIL